MLEIKVTVVIPGMPEAINNLAQALTNSSVPAHPRTVQNISIETTQAAPKVVAEQPVVVPQTNTEITHEPIAPESTPAVQTTPIAPAPTPTPAPAPVTNAKKYTREEIAKAGLDKEVNQYFAALTNMRSVGVMGDFRTYDYAVALRAVKTIDFMTAESAEIPYAVLNKVMNRIINEVKGVNRVFYDLTSKPPGTIEFE